MANVIEIVIKQSGQGNAISSTAKELGGLDKAASSSIGALGSFGSALSSMGKIAGGIIAADIFGNIVSGIQSFASAGLEAVSHAQLMEASLGALLTQNNLYQQTTETVSVAVGDLAKMQGEAAAKSDDLAFKQRQLTAEINTQNASIQEQKQRIMQMAEGLDKNQQVARLQEMEVALEGMNRELSDTITEQGKLNNITQEYTTVTKTSWEQTMSMAEAQKLAKEQTKELLGFVEKLAIVSPFEQEDVEKVTQYAIGAGLGVDATKDFTAGFLDLAAAVGISSVNLDEAAYQLLQVKKAGVLTKVDLRQLSTRGIDLARIIGIEMGMSVDEFNKKAEQTPAIFDELIQAVTDYSKNTFAGTSEAMSTSLEGFRSTISDLFTQSAKKILRPLVDAISPTISEMIGVATDYITGGQAEAIGKALADTVISTFSSLANIGQLLATGDFKGGIFNLEEDSLPIDLLFRARDAFTALAGGFDKVRGAYERFGLKGAAVSLLGQLGMDPETIELVRTTINDIATTISTSFDKISGAYERFGAKGAAVSILGQLGMDPETIGTINTTLLSISEDISTFVDNVMLAFDRFGAEGAAFSILGQLGVSSDTLVTLKTTLDEIITGITDFVTQIQTAFTGGAEEGGLTGGFSAIFESWKTALPTLAGEILANIPTVLTTITDAIGEFFQTNIPAFQELLAEWGPTFWKWTDNVIMGIGTAMAGILVALTAWATGPEAATSLNGVGEGIGQVIVNSIGLFFDNIPELTKSVLKIVSALAMAVVGITANLIIIGGQIAAGIIDGILQSLGIDLQPAAFEELAGIFAQIGRDFTTIATELGKKLAKLIVEGWTNAKNTLAGIGANLKIIFTETLKSAQEILTDPEKWLEIGESIMTGLLDGIKKHSSIVLEYLKSLLGSFLDVFTGSQGLDSQSPSQTMADIGADAIEGFGVGAQSMAGQVTDILGGITQNMIGAMDPSQFIDDLDMGGFAVELGGHGTAWKNWRRILQQQIGANFQGLMSGAMSEADIIGQIESQAAHWELPPTAISSFAKANGLIQHLTSNVATLKTQLQEQALAKLGETTGSWLGLGSSLAGMLSEQMGDTAGAKSAVDKITKSNQKLNEELASQQIKLITLQAELAKMTESEGANTIAIDKKKLAIEKTTEAIGFNQRQLAIYTEELSTLEEGTLAWEKKKLQIDKTTESIDAQEKQLTTLEEELANLNATTEGYEEKKKAVDELTKAMDKNKQAIKANSDELASLATSSDAGKLEALKAFLDDQTQSLFHMHKELADGTISDFYIDRAAAEEEYNRLLEEQRKREEAIAKQKELQQKFDFFKLQTDLISQAKALGGNLLAGLQLGADAKVEDLLELVNRISMAMVDQIDDSLEIGSPSKLLFRKFRDQVGGAMIGGLQAAKPMLERATVPLMNPLVNGGQTIGRITNNYFNQTVNTAATDSTVIGDFRTMQLIMGP